MDLEEEARVEERCRGAERPRHPAVRRLELRRTRSGTSTAPRRIAPHANAAPRGRRRSRYGGEGLPGPARTARSPRGFVVAVRKAPRRRHSAPFAGRRRRARRSMRRPRYRRARPGTIRRDDCAKRASSSAHRKAAALARTRQRRRRMIQSRSAERFEPRLAVLPAALRAVAWVCGRPEYGSTANPRAVPSCADCGDHPMAETEASLPFRGPSCAQSRWNGSYASFRVIESKQVV